MDCYCDYEQPAFYKAIMRTARTAHRCYECHSKIQPGDRYEYVSGLWVGYFSQFKTCARCLNLRSYTLQHIKCTCWGHGNMIEDCIESLREFAHELPGLLFGGYRRQVLIKKAFRE